MAASKVTDLLGSDEEFRELFKKAFLGTQQGVSTGMDTVVALGRKPIS